MFTRPGSLTQAGGGDECGHLTISIEEQPEPMTLGLWLNSGGWPAHDPVHHVGIEAGFGDHDDLSRAHGSGSTLVVQPRQAASWTIAIRVSQSALPELSP